MTKTHSFHIPVMGIAFTLDTPYKVAPYGIDSVISLIDDILMEKMRKMYCEKFDLLYQEISENMEDFRARRITSYLNLINTLAKKKFDSLRAAGLEKGSELRKYLEMLPSGSEIRERVQQAFETSHSREDLDRQLASLLQMGSIDVNIMTKVDKDNYRDDEKLPVEYNDAHAALRGFAESELNASLILSAGMNPRLYGYLEHFDVFFPNSDGQVSKKIVLKVSDYRSAFIQGKFLANKGLWVSEYRIESGLNCGGHAFATDGYLMGPILAEFRDKREELSQTLYEIWAKALNEKGRFVPEQALPIRISAQGGVGTTEEHQFLLHHYHVDSVGWGTPFLLVPEATTVDEHTLDQLVAAKEEDLYTSGISPLGVPFNTLRGNTKDQEKYALIAKNRPGSSCPKKYVALNSEFTEKSICTASRQYQDLKIKELNKKDLPAPNYAREYARITEKSCICVGLGTAALLVNDLSTKREGKGVSICPGPNLAYFSRIMSLREITDHIYGRINVITRSDRPNMFIKELGMYIDFLKNKITEVTGVATKNDIKYLNNFAKNLGEGISYYSGLFSSEEANSEMKRSGAMETLMLTKCELEIMQETIDQMQLEPIING